MGEDFLKQQFMEMFGQLCFDDKIFKLIRQALQESHADEQREHDEAVAALQAEHKRLEKRINAMYTDKLDGRISTEFFDKMSEQLHEEQSQCLKNIELRQGAERSYMKDGIRLLDLAVNAESMFETQKIRSKRQLFKFLLSNSQLDGKNLVATFRNPFEMPVKTNAAIATAKTEKAIRAEWRE